MRILFIHNRYLQPGGEDVALDLEEQLLRQKGHAVSTLIFDNTAMDGWLQKVQRGVSAIYSRRSAREVDRAIRDFKPDVLHVHNLFFTASPSVIRTAARHHIPVVMTLHNYRLICANALLLRDNAVCTLCVQKVLPLDGIRYKCYHGSAVESGLVTAITGWHKMIGTWQRKVDAYITLTEFARSQFRASSMASVSDRLRLLPNFIFDPGMGRPPAGRDRYYLFVGRISQEKGVGVLLEAFSRLAGSNLVIIGDGPERSSLEEKYRSFSNIRFAGPQPKTAVLEAMKECRALVFPSIWYEGLPFTIIEAFATGTPVLASAIGSMQELIRDGYNGLHFQPGDANALIRVISAFEASPEAYSPLYGQARQTWGNNYHPEIHYNNLIGIYESVSVLKPAIQHA